MKKISTRMLVCILTVAVLCSILAVGAIAASSYSFTIIVASAGENPKSASPVTVKKSELGSAATLNIESNSYGHGMVAIMSTNGALFTYAWEFGKNGYVETGDKSLTYFPKFLLPSTSKIAPRVVNMAQGFMGSSCQLAGTWRP